VSTRSRAGAQEPVPVEPRALLADMPGWSWDAERQAFSVRVPTESVPVEFAVGGGLTVVVVMVHEMRAEVRLSPGARQWTRTRLEAVRSVGRFLRRQSAPADAAKKRGPRPARRRL
jgi:hypothetical protein